MYLTLLIAEAFALDCATLDPDVCAATQQAVDAANAEWGEERVVETAVQRLRPTTLYNRLQAVADGAVAEGCTLDGSVGGVYWPDATFDGTWADLDGASSGVSSGTVDRSARTFVGTFSGDESGGLGAEFAIFNSAGQLASDRNGGFHIGVWVPVAGRTGMFATLYGTCANDPQEVFDDWYNEDLMAAGSGCSAGYSTYYQDADSDGFGDSAQVASLCEAGGGYVASGGDCDDSTAHTYPGAVEQCDGVRNDCDNAAWSDDDGLASVVKNDVWTSVTASLAAGLESAPVDVDVNGTLQVCPGTWFVHVDLDNNSGVQGIGTRETIVLDGGASSRVVNARANGDAFVSGVVVQNGSAVARGGGIRAQGPDTFTLSDVVLRDNYSADRGGGLHAQSLDTLTVDNVEITGNTDGGSLYGGGAIVFDIDAVDFTAVVIDGNTGASGSGVAFYRCGVVELNDVSILNNDGSSRGGGMSLVGSVVNGTNVTMAGNTVSSAGGGVDVSGSTLTLVDSTISDNTANFGGALRTHSGGTADLQNVIVTNNTATTGGAFHLAVNTSITVTDSEVTSNQQTSAGRAVVNLSGTSTSFTAVNTEFSDNTDFDVKATDTYSVGATTDFVCDQDGCVL